MPWANIFICLFPYSSAPWPSPAITPGCPGLQVGLLDVWFSNVMLFWMAFLGMSKIWFYYHIDPFALKILVLFLDIWIIFFGHIFLSVSADSMAFWDKPLYIYTLERVFRIFDQVYNVLIIKFKPISVLWDQKYP